jgi:signal transduction histidine kinase
MRNYRLRTTCKLLVPVRYRHVRRDGSAVPMFWSVTWVEEDQACYCVGRDMTEQDELQERAAQSQRMDAIGQLTGGIAHDFNNLLTVILGNCQVLALKLKEPRLAKLAAMSARAAEQGAGLVEQLLAYGRRQPLKPKRFAVDELLDAAAPLIRRTLGRISNSRSRAARTCGRSRRSVADRNRASQSVHQCPRCHARGGKL